MIIGMVVALLAACAYIVLRYFGVVPGYGVNTNPETGIYILEEPAVLEMEDCTLTITDGWWNDGLLILQYSVEAPGQTADSIWDLVNDLGLRNYTLEGLDNFSFMGDSISVADEQHAGGEWYARGGLPEGTGDTLELRLTGAASPIPLTLRRAETEVSFDRAGYYDLTEDQGGLLAIPRLENGELIVSIYPLNEGDFTIDAGLTKLCGELAPVTVALGEIYDRFSWWTIAAEWTCTAPDRELANVSVAGNGKMLPSIEVVIDGANTAITPFYLEPQKREVAEPETGWTYQAPGDLLVGCYEGIDEVYAYISPRDICYRWNHEFVIPFAVSETE